VSPRSPSGGGFKGYDPLPAYIASSAKALWDYQPQLNMLLVFVPIAIFCEIAGEDHTGTPMPLSPLKLCCPTYSCSTWLGSSVATPSLSCGVLDA
jgi:hypothetical protein